MFPVMVMRLHNIQNFVICLCFAYARRREHVRMKRFMVFKFVYLSVFLFGCFTSFFLSTSFLASAHNSLEMLDFIHWACHNFYFLLQKHPNVKCSEFLQFDFVMCAFDALRMAIGKKMLKPKRPNTEKCLLAK